jgi:hypothetical protein
LQVDEIPKLVNLIKDDLFQQFYQALELEPRMNQNSLVLDEKINDLKGVVLASVKQIAGRFQQEHVQSAQVRYAVENSLQSQSVNQGQQSKNSDAVAYVDDQVNDIRSMIGTVNRKVDQLVADTQQGSVKFNGFGFRRPEEAHAWLEMHSPNYNFSLIVEVHMVFEQLHSTSAKTVPTLQQLRKIDMKDMSQGVAVSSFDHRLPKLLTDSHGYVAMNEDESYFEKIKTYKDWETPHTGFRDRLKQELNAFELSHKLMVENNTIPTSPLQATASLSRTYALSWIADSIVFIDDTYKELTEAKFSSERGWSLITKLAS